jgi:hypothetical protein
VLSLFGVNIQEVVTGCGFWEAYYTKGYGKAGCRGYVNEER